MFQHQIVDIDTDRARVCQISQDEADDELLGGAIVLEALPDHQLF